MWSAVLAPVELTEAQLIAQIACETRVGVCTFTPHPTRLLTPCLRTPRVF